MNKEQVLDYVMTTPHNPNRAVLNDMLNGLGGSEGEGEVWVTYLQEEDTDGNNVLLLDCNNEQVECSSGTTTTKTSTELIKCFAQTDGIYKRKVKGYFSNLPDAEVDIVYRGSLDGWNCNYSEKYGDNYEWYCDGEIEAEDIGAEIEIEFYYYDISNSTEIYPTKIELIVYKQ